MRSLGRDGAIYTSFTNEIRALNLPPDLLEQMNVDSFLGKAGPKEYVNPFVKCMEAMGIIEADNTNALICNAFLSTLKGNTLY